MIPTSIPAALIFALTLATGNAAPRSVKCRVVAFAKSPGLPAELFSPAKSEGEFTKTLPSLSVETVPVELSVSENGAIPFSATADAAGPVIASAMIPPGVKSSYLFLLPDPAPEDAVLFQVVAIEDSPQSTPPGGAMVHNAFTAEARVTVGKEIYPLPAGQSVGIPTPAEKDESNMATLKIEIKSGDQWTIVKDGLTRFSLRDSYLIFTYSGTQPGQAQVKIYQKSVTIPAVIEKKGKRK